MTEAQIYIEVAERALTAADGALQKNVQEKASFLGYHAFESTGGAFCKSRGVPFPPGHRKKIATFTAAVRRERFGRTVAELAISYGSLRNPLLYPIPLQNGTIQRPQDVITTGQARRLLGRTKALLVRVKPGV
jgi:hypothetical protein